MKKDFNSWNKEIKQINEKTIGYDFFYHNSEIWWCAIGANVGVETDGKQDNFERPVLVVKKFNKEQFWGVPLTTNPKDDGFHYKIRHGDSTSWVMLSQMRVLSSKRLLRKIGKISKDQFKQIQNKLKDLL